MSVYILRRSRVAGSPTEVVGFATTIRQDRSAVSGLHDKNALRQAEDTGRDVGRESLLVGPYSAEPAGDVVLQVLNVGRVCHRVGRLHDRLPDPVAFHSDDDVARLQRERAGAPARGDRA